MNLPYQIFSSSPPLLENLVVARKFLAIYRNDWFIYVFTLTFLLKVSRGTWIPSTSSRTIWLRDACCYLVRNWSSDKLSRTLNIWFVYWYQLDTQFLYKLHKVKFLYMFRATSAHPQEVNDVNCTCMQPLVFSFSAGGRLVHLLRENMYN